MLSFTSPIYSKNKLYSIHICGKIYSNAFWGKNQAKSFSLCMDGIINVDKDIRKFKLFEKTFKRKYLRINAKSSIKCIFYFLN
jgi:hypothetical protein